MKTQRKRSASSNYYIEQFNEDDLSYEDNSSYDSNVKHPNWDQRIVLSRAKSFDAQHKNAILESSDSIYFSLQQNIELENTGIELIQNYLDPVGKILACKETGLSAKKQRQISKVIRRARANGLIAHIF